MSEGKGDPLKEGLVDLWPLMAESPRRRTLMYLTDPWLQTHYIVLYRAGETAPASDFQGSIGHYSQTLHGRLVRQRYPKATERPYATREAIIQGICQGEVDAAFLEERLATRLLREREGDSLPCALMPVLVPNLLVRFSLVSTAEARPAARRIRAEIGQMARDGALADHLAHYADQGVHDGTAAFELAQADAKSRWLLAAALSLVALLLVVFWLYWVARSAHRTAENAVRSLEIRKAHFRTLLEHSADLIAAIDRRGILTYVSPSCPRLLGWEATDLLNRDFRSLLHPDDLENVEAALAALPSPDEPPLRLWFRLRHHANSYRSFQAMARRPPEAQPSGGDDGAYSAVINARDITEETRLQEQLQQSQKMEAVGRLAGAVAHDFNNLLTIINGYSELASTATDCGETVANSLRQIRKSGEQAALLTRQLLTFSRRQVYQPMALNLNTVISDSESMLRRLLGAHIQLAVRLDSALGPVRADPGQMNQILLNLLANARDSMPGGGTVQVETSVCRVGPSAAGERAVPPGNFALLTVADSGSGMDRETQQRIFEPFFTTKAEGKGTGLGLATVYGIVRQHQGWIEVDSELGRGTTFRVMLPLADSAARPHPAESGAESPANIETILIVDDLNPISRLTAATLQSCGYAVLEAGSQDQALAVAGQHGGPIHLIVSHAIMNGMSVTQWTGRLRAERPEAKVMFMSGHPPSAFAAAGILKAGVHFLAKPFTPDFLAAKVRSVLDSPAS